MAGPRATETLREAGIANPARLVTLIRRTIAALELDLSGLTVLTEAASGAYVVTPLIAALAGAEQVFALTRDSRYAAAEDVIRQTEALAELCDVPGRVEVHTRRDPALFARADIVTNLGFVRPVDAAAIAALKPTAVVPLMCEAWELRPGDVDVAACRARDIPVLGTNEEYPGLEVFAYCGWLALKMLFDAQIEVHKAVIVVVSSDPFGGVIAHRLAQAGADAHLVSNLRERAIDELTNADAVIIADYGRQDMIIGAGGDLVAADLVRVCPSATVLQFVGRVDVSSLNAAGIHVHPGTDLGARRMALTLAGLGPRPVIELHAAGLKVGEVAARARLAGRSAVEISTITLRGHVLGQAVDGNRGQSTRFKG